VRELRAAGLEYLTLATQLLQRVRLTDPEAGVWEAADLQWWWRTPRRSDTVEQTFWLDEDGPAAGIVLTEWRHGWACDAIVVPGSGLLPVVWSHAVEAIDLLERVETLVRDDDAELIELVAGSGFARSDGTSGATWLDAVDRRPVARLPGGFRLVDRTGAARPHPMRRRNGDAVEDRLRQTSLYDPWLDLAVETETGETAGYALFWLDPVTQVGLLEPMRVEDAYQRRGLARALLTEGLSRLADRGALRFKVGYATEPARRLYTGAGFRVAETSTSYVRSTASIVLPSGSSTNAPSRR